MEEDEKKTIGEPHKILEVNDNILARTRNMIYDGTLWRCLIYVAD